MTIKIQTPNGQVSLTQDVISTVEILGQENYSKGVVITQRGDDVLVDVYILVSYGTKISVICQNIQQAVKYSVEQLLGFEVSYVNVHVQGVKID